MTNKKSTVRNNTDIVISTEEDAREAAVTAFRRNLAEAKRALRKAGDAVDDLLKLGMPGEQPQ
jgi:hypothetical protein